MQAAEVIAESAEIAEHGGQEDFAGNQDAAGPGQQEGAENMHRQHRTTCLAAAVKPSRKYVVA
jgi:hypothetical protein